MGYQGNYPPSTPLTSSQIGTGAVTSDAIADGAVVPADLSTGAPSWDTSGNVGIGTSSPAYKLNVYDATLSSVFVQGDAGANIVIQRSSTDSSGAQFAVRKTRGTVASPTAITSGDSAGTMLFQVYGGTNYRNIAYIAGNVDTYTSDTDISGNMRFYTSPSGSAAAIERMRIDSSGNVGIGTSSPSTKLHVVGEVTATQGVGGYPAFHATAGGAQTVSNGVNTKITLTEDFDTNADFASSRFTPSVAGYYQINGAVWSNAGTSMNYAGALIYKNGSAYSLSYGAAYTSTSANGMISDIVYLNGSTDYVELYGRVVGTGTLTINNNTFFSGCLVRGA